MVATSTHHRPPHCLTGDHKTPMGTRLNGNHMATLEFIILTRPIVFCISRCSDECSGQGYTFAGVAVTSWCRCGNSLPPNNKKKSENHCDHTCPGDHSKKCGGSKSDGYRMNIYEIVATTTTLSSGCLLCLPFLAIMPKLNAFQGHANLLQATIP